MDKITPSTRLRRLSAEEIELWLRVTEDVTPRPGSRLPQAPAPPHPPHVRLPGALAPEPVKAPLRQKTPPPLAPLDRRLRQKLARGRAAPEALIDLHGMRQREAFMALRAFLENAQSEGVRLVLVVTGKGERAASHDGVAAGILRRSLPVWLRDPFYYAIVAGFEEAQRPHGGAGAFYIRLRRRDRVSIHKGGH